MRDGDVVVGIEGKADESLGSQLIGDAIVNASGNKMHRIRGMIKMLFADAPENHKAIRYQLITATAATFLLSLLLAIASDERAELHTCGTRCAHVKVRVDACWCVRCSLHNFTLDFLVLLVDFFRLI